MIITILESDDGSVLFTSKSQEWRNTFSDPANDYDSCSVKDIIRQMELYSEFANNELKEECLFELG